MPEAQIERIVPTPDWQPAVAALDDTLTEWLVTEHLSNPSHTCVFVIAPPHGGHGDMLTAWARHHDWRIVNPPKLEQILTQDLTWLEEQVRHPSPGIGCTRLRPAMPGTLVSRLHRWLGNGSASLSSGG